MVADEGLRASTSCRMGPSPNSRARSANGSILSTAANSSLSSWLSVRRDVAHLVCRAMVPTSCGQSDLRCATTLRVSPTVRMVSYPLPTAPSSGDGFLHGSVALFLSRCHVVTDLRGLCAFVLHPDGLSRRRMQILLCVEVRRPTRQRSEQSRCQFHCICRPCSVPSSMRACSVAASMR